MTHHVFLRLILCCSLAAGLFAACSKSAKEPDKEKAAPAEQKTGPRVSHDTNGQVVIALSAEVQRHLEMVVKKPESAHMLPETKAYGQVLDPEPLSALLTEWASAQAAFQASSNEWVRLRTLAEQSNTSAKALQAAEASAQRDRIAVQSAKDRLLLSWGPALLDQPDLAGLIQSLAKLDAALVRLDVAGSEKLGSGPQAARIVALSGQSQEAKLLAPAPRADPQMQGRGFLFLVTTNSTRLVPGQAVTGYLQLPGPPLLGVSIPRQAVVRTEGSAWIYVRLGGGETFRRTEIPVDRPTDSGWFSASGVSTNDEIVVVGAQQLLSAEMKGQLGE